MPKREVTEHPLLHDTWVYRGVAFSKAASGIFQGQWTSQYLRFKDGEHRVRAPTRNKLLELIDVYREMYPE
jgi:hypothetical protein